MTSRRPFVPQTAVLVLAAAALMAVPGATHAATIVVSTTVDVVDAGSDCSLRGAVIAANTDTTVGGCAAGSGADTIVVPAGVYELTLTGPGDNGARTGDLDLAGRLTIFGAGAAATVIDGGGWREGDASVQDRVLHVLGRAEVTVAGITIRNGVCTEGCGILNTGVLVVEDSRVEGNGAWPGAQNEWPGGAGIFNRGRLWMVRSSLSYNSVSGALFEDVLGTGGGLANGAWARLERTAVAGNYAAAGSGIDNFGSLEMVESTIRANGARFWGAGMQNLGIAHLLRTTVSANTDGAIINGHWTGSTKGQLVLQDSTVSGNHSWRLPGAILAFTGDVKILNSTVADNDTDDVGAGINVWPSFGARVFLANSILANGPFGDCVHPVVSWGLNIDGDGSCGLTGPGDLPLVDPMLGPLADNGGSTPTHALRAGSPAVDHVPVGKCRAATDQRGVPRPQGDACDVGAFERRAADGALALVPAAP